MKKLIAFTASILMVATLFTNSFTVSTVEVYAQDGYECDALVLDDSEMYSTRQLTVKERVERTCYNDADVKILHKFVQGINTFNRDGAK